MFMRLIVIKLRLSDFFSDSTIKEVKLGKEFILKFIIIQIDRCIQIIITIYESP